MNKKEKYGERAVWRGERAVRFLFLAVVFCCFSLLFVPFLCFSQVFSPQQMQYLCRGPGDPDFKPGEEGAETKMQYFYHFLRPDRGDMGEGVVMPAWLDEILPAMVNRQVWEDPNEGILSEAQLWQGPISVLFEFFEITKKVFPPSEGGLGSPPGKLTTEYAQNRTRYNMSLDRLYRAKLGGSFQGRGRTLLSYFDLVSKEYDSLMDALIRADGKDYIGAVLAAAYFSHMAYKQMYAPPRGGVSGRREVPGKAVATALSIAGLFLMFLAGLQFGNLNQQKMMDMVEEYKRKSQVWAQEYNKQFVAIRVHYLVFVPFGLFALMGVLSGSFIAFFLLSAIGLYLGLRMPQLVLTHIRRRRGKQVEVQLIDALVLLGNSLKSGLDLVQGFQMVQKELLPPISDEFGLVIKNYQLGASFEKALEGMEERIESRLLSYMVKAIVLQRQTGGNLIKIFDRIVEYIREEAKLEEKTNSLTAQQRIQSIVVGIMPWVMLVIMFLFQGPAMAKFYLSPLGIVILISCIVWILIGMRFVSKLGQIRV